MVNDKIRVWIYGILWICCQYCKEGVQDHCSRCKPVSSWLSCAPWSSFVTTTATTTAHQQLLPLSTLFPVPFTPVPCYKLFPSSKQFIFFGQVWDSGGEIDKQWKWRHLVYKIIWVTVSFFLTLEIIETLSRPPWTLPKIIVQKFWSRQWLQSAESTPNDGPMNSTPIEPLNFLDLPNLIDLLLLERRIRTSLTHAEQTLE